MLSADTLPDRGRPVALVLVSGDRLALAVWTHLRDTSAGLDAVPMHLVDASSPTLPDLDASTRVVLVVSAGTVTAPEVLAIAGACQDAGAPPSGVLVVGAAGSAPGPSMPARPAGASASGGTS